MRTVERTYQDPIELIWLDAARQMGMRIERDTDVFASWDGQGTLRIGVPETLDADDNMAQMILHETCHALVEGPEGFNRPDWGLEIDNPAHRVREDACLRLQAALTEPFGLRQFFAATTTFRRYYDRLPLDPLADGADPAIEPARAGFERAHHGPWAQPLSTALELTSQIAAIVQPVAREPSLWGTFEVSVHKS